MTVDFAIDIARRSIYHATFRDAYSGGSVNGISKLNLVYHVKEDGWEFISCTDVMDLHYKYVNEPRPKMQ